MEPEYELFVEDRNVTPFLLHNVSRSIAERSTKYFGKTPSDILQFTEGKVKWYAHSKEFEQYAKLITSVVCDKPETLIEFNRSYKKAIEEMRAFSKKLYVRNLTKLSTAELWEIYLSGVEKYEKVYEYGIIPFFADSGQTSQLSANLKEKLSHYTKDANIAFITLSNPDKPSQMLLEEKNLMQLALDSNNVNQNSSAIKKHQKEFFWLTFGYEGPIYSIEEIWKRICELRQNKDLKELLEKNKNYAFEVKKEQLELLSKLKLNKKIMQAFRITREWMLFKELRKASFFAAYVGFDRLAGEIAKRLTVSKSDVKFLTKEELKSALFENTFPSDLKQRKINSIYYYKNGKFNIITGTEAQEFIKDNIKPTEEENQSIIRGQVAFPGIIKGTVKIVNEPSDMAKMQDGDILVSSATNPNLLPAMKKAVAFVTNVGGITCHAAIVAREMKKPCVIGTKIATKLLKDGDLIEVNADIGEVRKL